MQRLLLLLLLLLLFVLYQKSINQKCIQLGKVLILGKFKFPYLRKLVSRLQCLKTAL